MKCPHCLVDFNDGQTWWSVFLGRDAQDAWLLARRRCPTCDRYIFNLENGALVMQPNVNLGTQNARLSSTLKDSMVHPRAISRAPIPPEVPREIIEDYKEACLVLADSAKASAALSRRCLQHLLRSAGGVKHGDLFAEIQEAIDGKTLPSGIADGLDAVRVIGNFAAHPIKSKNTGEIVDVEVGEAEWNLDVLESLFDFYYVLPARTKAKKDALNKKLAEAGKPPLK
jgi:Domain of unknown function (DUF4145)